jgi:hypothetical protein
VVVAAPPERLDELTARAGGVPVLRLGRVEGDSLAVAAPAATLSVPVEDLKIAYEQAIPDLLT